MRYPKGRDRKVLAIAMLDANSVGVLFRERCQEDLSKTELLDRKRRRSFRFNATWWGAFGGSLDDVSRGDRVAAWVAAGDDVILAEYGQVENSQGEAMAYPETVIEDVLENLATNLQVEFNEFESGLFLSYSAGLAVSSGQRIGDLLKASLRREKSAKNRWKTEMKGHKMLETANGFREPERQEEADDSEWIRDTKSIVVKGDTEDDDSGAVEVKEFSSEEFHDWNEELIQKVCNHYQSHLGSSPDDDDKFGILKRHYIKECDGAKTLYVLVPKLVSSPEITGDEGKGAR